MNSIYEHGKKISKSTKILKNNNSDSNKDFRQSRNCRWKKELFTKSGADAIKKLTPSLGIPSSGV